jgi:hypothetical protein
LVFCCNAVRFLLYPCIKVFEVEIDKWHSPWRNVPSWSVCLLSGFVWDVNLSNTWHSHRRRTSERTKTVKQHAKRVGQYYGAGKGVMWKYSVIDSITTEEHHKYLSIPYDVRFTKSSPRYLEYDAAILLTQLPLVMGSKYWNWYCYKIYIKIIC